MLREMGLIVFVWRAMNSLGCRFEVAIDVNLGVDSRIRTINFSQK